MEQRYRGVGFEFLWTRRLSEARAALVVAPRLRRSGSPPLPGAAGGYGRRDEGRRPERLLRPRAVVRGEEQRPRLGSRDGPRLCLRPRGTDCSPIQSGGPCYDPIDIQSLASFAFNDYFLKNGPSQQSCDCSGTAALTSLIPTCALCWIGVFFFDSIAAAARGFLSPLFLNILAAWTCILVVVP
ncbi:PLASMODESMATA CALLOSE-BINDING PROTEIN 5 [Nymphaea thermarum]|nr:PLASMODESMATA CALLOSE-BINDING PROTEIN 5 [Nymphaea thermarum]